MFCFKFNYIAPCLVEMSLNGNISQIHDWCKILQEKKEGCIFIYSFMMTKTRRHKGWSFWGEVDMLIYDDGDLTWHKGNFLRRGSHIAHLWEPQNPISLQPSYMYFVKTMK